MKKTVKIIAILLLISTMVMVTMPVFAGASDLITDVTKDVTIDKDNAVGLATMAGKVISMIRTIAVIGGVVIITFLGIKFMMGSAEEKAEYKKSFMPLIIGIVVVMAASQIATMLFGLMGA